MYNPVGGINLVRLNLEKGHQKVVNSKGEKEERIAVLFWFCVAHECVCVCATVDEFLEM